jgi:hypothetical protein
MKGMAGNYFEIIVDEFICIGKYSKCRKLGERHAEIPISAFNIRKEPEPFEILNPRINSLLKAFDNCLEPNVLYNFCKNFPAVDFMIHDFQFCFQSTESASHSIHLASIVSICDYVRSKDETAKVRLMFVVPSTVCTGTNWRYTQSFRFYEDSVDVNGARVMKERTCKFEKLPEAVKHSLRNLEQWVIQWDLE